MTFKLELNLDGSAFDTQPALALANVLEDLAEKLCLDGFENTGTETREGATGTMRDRNGNTIGQWTLNL